MLHCSLRAAPGTLFFRTWEEGCALWSRLAGRVRFRALVIMPDHLHVVLPDAGELRALHTALRAYALWRNRKRGESGPVFEHRSEPRPVQPNSQHEARTLRYVHLNPARAGLVSDPAAWPLSSYRDALGLAWPPATGRARDPERYHASVTRDGDGNVRAAPLPPRSGTGGEVSLADVVAAVSALTRTPESGLRARGPARTLLVCAARRLTRASAEDVAAVAGVHPWTVRRLGQVPHPAIELVRRVAGDPRFALLRDGDLRSEPSWRRYRHLR